jgi:RNA recognition motif-containing protein
LDSPSEDESNSSKFARSRASSEDSLYISEEETLTVPRNRLFVGGIPLQLREHEIDELFSKFGKVKHVIVLKTKYGTSKVLLNS